jgi:mono/diheme cytochrome c family protein
VSLKLAGLGSNQLEVIGNGSYLVNAVADCASCHGSGSTYLGGGCTAPVDGGPPACSGASFTVPAGGDAGVTTVYARNLTPDSATGLTLSFTQFEQVMRTGADFKSSQAHTLIVMPWAAFRWMSSYDLASIYFYLQAVPPVSNAVPADSNLRTPAPSLPVEPTVYTAGDQDGGTALPPQTAPVPFVDASTVVPDPDNVLRGLAINPLREVSTTGMDTATLTLFGRGSYLVNAAAECSGCHTNRDGLSIDNAAYLNGGVVFDVPPPFWSQGYVRAASADLIGTSNGFFQPNLQFNTFETLITQGVHAEDPAPQRGVSWPMPWDKFKHMTLNDLEAVFTYMHTVAAQYGASVPDKRVPDPARFCSPAVACPSGSTCSSSTGAGECLNGTCSTSADCAICQSCSATDGGTGSCQVMSPGALAACEGIGL